MNKLKFLLVSLVTFLFTFVSVQAAETCNYEEKAQLNSEVANIKVNYEVKQRQLDTSEYDVPDSLIGENVVPNVTVDYIQVNILNLTENLYVEVSNDYNKELKTFKYSDTKNGNISFDWSEVDTIVTFTIKVYASSNTGCEGESLTSRYVALPRYNSLAEYAVCNKVPDFYLCQRYVTFDDNVEFPDFIERVNEQIEKNENGGNQDGKNNKWLEKIIDFIVDHKVAFITGGVMLIVVAGGVAIVIIRRRRRSAI